MPDTILEVLSVSKKFEKASSPKTNGEVGWSSLVRQLIKRKEELKEAKSFYALNDINFSINRGESLGIIGLNGSGKSTLLQIIAGTMKPTAGHIVKKGRVAALLELGSGFNPQFTGRENVFLNAALLGLSTKDCTKKFSQIEEFADIGDFIDEPVSTYSTGMCLRLAFAVIANIKSDILIVDEALAVGDTRFQLKCYSFLEHFKNKGGSLILVSHDLNSIARLCSNSILLHEGSLIASGKPIDVINIYSKMITDDTTVDTKKVSTEISNGNEIINCDEPKKLNYGGQLGKIKSVQINHNSCSIIHSGDIFKISFVAQSYSDIKYPIFAMRIRDSKGVEIYGTNTKLQKTITNGLKLGDLVKVEFTSKANLGAGKYFISLGFTCIENNELKVIHRLREHMNFEVLGDESSFGISNCFSEIVVEQTK